MLKKNTLKDNKIIIIYMFLNVLTLFIKEFKGGVDAVHCLMMMSNEITCEINMINLIYLGVKE